MASPRFFRSSFLRSIISLKIHIQSIEIFTILLQIIARSRLFIHPFLQIFTGLEKREFFRSDFILFAGFGVTAGIWLVFFDVN